MSKTLVHHTITTGHMCKRHLEEVDPEHIKVVRAAINYALGETDPVQLYPGLDPKASFLMEAFTGGGLKCSVFYDGGKKPVLVFIVVKNPDREARKQYKDLVSIDIGDGRAAKDMPPAPFCSAAITEAGEYCFEIVTWVGDFEGVVALSWLYGDGDDASRKPVKSIDTIVGNLNMWIVTGAECFAPTQETIELLGKEYLTKLIDDSKAMILPTADAGDVDFLARLEELRKMID